MSATHIDGSGRPALSEQLKEAAKTWVPRIRGVLEGEFGEQLRRLGLKPDGRHTPVEQMGLAEEGILTRHRVEVLVRRDEIAEGSPKSGFENVKRELAYTLLNRLVGLKSMEARNLLYLPPPSDPEAPQSRPKS